MNPNRKKPDILADRRLIAHLARFLTVALGLTTAIANAQTPDLVVQTGHSGGIGAIAFSPDGRFLATGGQDATVKLWDVASGREIRTFYGFTNAVTDVEFSPDGSSITASGDQVVRTWNASSGAASKPLIGHTWNVVSVKYSPDGKTLATASIDQTVRVWDAASATEIHAFKGNDRFGSISFTPDGKVLAAAGDGYTISIFDLQTFRRLKEIRGIGPRVHSLEFLSDSKTLISGDADHIKYWDVNAGTAIAPKSPERGLQVARESGVSGMALTHDRKSIAAIYWSRATVLALWDSRSGDLLADLDSVTAGRPDSLAVSPDGRTIATGGRSMTGECEIKIWSIPDARETRVIGRSRLNDVRTMFVDPKNDAIATTSSAQVGGGTRLWNLRKADLLKTFHNETNKQPLALITPTGTLIRGVADGTEIFDIPSGKRERVIAGLHLDDASVFTPDGKLVITPRYKDVAINELASGKQIGIIEDFDRSYWLSIPHLLAVHPDGKLLAGLDKWGKVRFWEIPSGRPTDVPCGETDFVVAFAFSPDGKSFATWDKGGVRSCPIDGSRPALKMQSERPEVRMDSLAFSPDSRLLVGIDLKFTYVWEAATGRMRMRLPGQTHASIFRNGVSFGAAGKVLFTTFGRSRIKMWDSENGRELASLLTFGEDEWVVVAPDGRFDTNMDLDSVDGLHWVFPDDPMNPISLDVLMRQYYEPGLLRRLLSCSQENSCGREFKALPPIGEIKRVRPRVSIRSGSEQR